MSEVGVMSKKTYEVVVTSKHNVKFKYRIETENEKDARELGKAHFIKTNKCTLDYIKAIKTAEWKLKEKK